MSSDAESTTKGSSKGKSKASKPILRSEKTDLQFPISRIKKSLRNGKYADKINEMTPVYLASVLEYLAAEVLDLAGKIAKGENKKTIKPRHISLVVQNDTELNKLFEGVIIPYCGGKPKIEENLLPNNNAELEGSNM